jgi:hypothetical protein
MRQYKIVYNPGSSYKSSSYCIYKRRFPAPLAFLVFVGLIFATIFSLGFFLVILYNLDELDTIFWKPFDIAQTLEQAIFAVEKEKLEKEERHSFYL